MDPMNRSSSSAALLVGAVAVPIAVCAVLSALIDVFVAPAAALVLVLVIVIVCLRGSWLVDALVIVVSAIGFDFFLTYPYRSMKIASRPDIEVTIVLFVVGAAIAGISRWALTASDLAERRQGYVTYALDARSGDMSRDEVAQRLAGLVGAEAGAWVDGAPPSGKLSFRTPPPCAPTSVWRIPLGWDSQPIASSVSPRPVVTSVSRRHRATCVPPPSRCGLPAYSLPRSAESAVGVAGHVTQCVARSTPRRCGLASSRVTDR